MLTQISLHLFHRKPLLRSFYSLVLTPQTMHAVNTIAAIFGFALGILLGLVSSMAKWARRVCAPPFEALDVVEDVDVKPRRPARSPERQRLFSPPN